LRILITSNYASPHIGGMELVVDQQRRSLAERGHEVTLVTTAHDRASRGRRSIQGTTVIRIAAVNTLDRRFELPYPILSPTALWHLRRLAATHDVVHVHDSSYPICQAVLLAARWSRRPVFVTQHVGTVAHPHKVVLLAQRAINKAVQKAFYKNVRKFVVYNSEVEKFLLESGVESTRILQTFNGIDTEYFFPATPEERKYQKRKLGLNPDLPVVIFVGRLVPKKGFDLVAGAARDDVQVLIVGPGRQPAALAGEVGVHFFGPASREQVRDLYRAADIFALPSDGEVFTLAMQEAMASGLPVVTTNEPAYAAAGLDPDGVCLVDRASGPVAEAIRAVAGDPGRRARMAAYSRRLVEERFSWDANYPAEYAIYQDVEAALASTARP
jgi:glycosyltransferase involved in cell wall biosynthesis